MNATETPPETPAASSEGRRALGWVVVVLLGAGLAPALGALGGVATSLGGAAAGFWLTALVALARRSDRGRARAAWWVRALAWWAPAGALALVLTAGSGAPWAGPLADLRAAWTERFGAPAASAGWIGGATLAAAALAGLLGPYLTARGERGLGAWLRGSAWLGLAAAVACLGRGYAGVGRPAGPDAPARARGSLGAELGDALAAGRAEALDATLATVLGALVALVAVEVLGRAALASWRRFYDRVPHPGARVATEALVPRLFASRANPVASLFGVLADGFGVDLRGTYALVVARRALGPLGLGLALVAWLATGLVTVPFDRVGVAERFGARLDAPLAPGPHLLPPWPLGRVELVAVDAIRSIDLGYRGARAEADRLWTVAHADEEFTLLLGDGLELVSVNARLEYRVADPVAFVYGVQNPHATLAALAERELTRATVDRRLEDVLSENLDRFGAEVVAAVQAAADGLGLGVELLGLVVQGLHPPLAVAEDYQRVVAAQVEQDRLRAQAEGYAERERFDAEARAATAVAEARAAATSRLARARGEAAAFTAVRAGSGAAPELFRLTAYLAALERALAGRPYHLVDRRIEADGGAIWLLE